MHSDSTHCKLVFPCPSKAAGLTVPVYTLRVAATLPADSLCDSLLFGLVSMGWGDCMVTRVATGLLSTTWLPSA